MGAEHPIMGYGLRVTVAGAVCNVRTKPVSGLFALHSAGKELEDWCLNLSDGVQLIPDHVPVIDLRDLTISVTKDCKIKIF